MIKAYIFDLDGVLVDTAKYHYLAWKELATRLGFEFTLEDNERLKGVSRMRSLDILLELGKVSVTEEEKQEMTSVKNKRYLEYVAKMDESEVLYGVRQFLDGCKCRGLKIALGSASRNASFILEQTKLVSYFDVVVDGNSVTKAKPDPEVFLKAVSMLGLVPSECVVFEDAVAGIEAARAAGCVSVGVGVGSYLLGADYHIDNFDSNTFFLL